MTGATGLSITTLQPWRTAFSNPPIRAQAKPLWAEVPGLGQGWVGQVFDSVRLAAETRVRGLLGGGSSHDDVVGHLSFNLRAEDEVLHEHVLLKALKCVQLPTSLFGGAMHTVGGVAAG
jgi:hypothetical protein